MTRRPTASRFTRLWALLGLVALLGVACGASTTTVSAERASGPPAVAAPSAASSTAGAVAPVSPAGTTHQYGTSIADWDQSSGESAQGSESNSGANESDTPFIEWPDLIPPGFSGEDIVARYETQLEEVEPGTAEANALYDEMLADFDPEAVNTELDGQEIRLAGFVAPLTYENELVTEFLLVPTFGACIHVPPPPPNQTIMVTLDNGLTTDESWGAVWVEGTITIEASETDLASASYIITNATSGSYNDF